MVKFGRADTIRAAASRLCLHDTGRHDADQQEKEGGYLHHAHPGPRSVNWEKGLLVMRVSPLQLVLVGHPQLWEQPPAAGHFVSDKAFRRILPTADVAAPTLPSIPLFAPGLAAQTEKLGVIPTDSVFDPLVDSQRRRTMIL